MIAAGASVTVRDVQRAYQTTGVVFRRRVSSRKLRSWSVSWALAPVGVLDLVLESWSLYGSVEPFSWDTPEGETVTVRFVREPLVRLASVAHANVSIELEEVL